ncbi:outer membrane protein assembly factor BamA [Pseudooceanicola sediminis]|uniref:Outer membrane protein assembly factor BamA n=1 Tax=Pseudooceanicola sediminis TaxID=2211117 RepID=A0A399JDH9_9RHOB|nr:outer membrane protein assembly factor BamA [Pseudooceanicola sediminis]KAA2316870.1 outer membrane protein assembly factor BamA [Puniceibacterium sp. HSS470]RII40676.1 outer membrane protein assembly factor BamA [Pseudooceanicola sediminis]
MNKYFKIGAASMDRTRTVLGSTILSSFVFLSGAYAVYPTVAVAQTYSFNSVTVQGNERIPTGTILSYAGIARGEATDAGSLNEAYQRIVASGLFETVELTPSGGTLVIKVTEFPTINVVNFEGNKRIKDEVLTGIVKSTSRQVFSPSQAEADAALISQAYAAQGRLAARVTPRIIRRSDNRVDLVFEVFEGGVTEVERISFVGNTKYSDRRLRQVLQSKQAGLLRVLFKNDTFVADRVEFDKQVLKDFYQSRGYVDFRITGVNAELSQERDGYLVTFNVQEGQQFRLGKISATSQYEGVDSAVYRDALNIKPGTVYSPSLIENSIARIERLAIRNGLDFLRVEPRVTRNDRDMTLDVDFVLTRGPRIFVERIDIEGNTTTLDRVIRAEFNTVEGDPFNPREIRESAERIRALGYFSDAQVNAREGSSSDQVIVDVNVDETTTGSLSFGGTYSTTDGFGLAISFKENNFLGRGQSVGLTVSGASSDRIYSLRFSEPRFLGRDLKFDLSGSYEETESDYAAYDTTQGVISTGLTFPAGEKSTLNFNYTIKGTDISSNSGTAIGPLLQAEADRDLEYSSSLGYKYSYDTRVTGLNPNAGVLLEFSQDFAGVGGDIEYIRSMARAVAQKKVLNEEVTLRATLRGGSIQTLGSSSSLVTDRFLIGGSYMRGFSPNGIGPREYSEGSYNDALGGTAFAVAQFDMEFPLGLPEEYGISGGVFYDVGTSWGLDESSSNVLYEDGPIRQVIGISVFWDTPIGPLRFNWSKALQKETYDREQSFDLSIRTDF